MCGQTLELLYRPDRNVKAVIRHSGAPEKGKKIQLSQGCHEYRSWVFPRSEFDASLISLFNRNLCQIWIVIHRCATPSGNTIPNGLNLERGDLSPHLDYR